MKKALTLVLALIMCLSVLSVAAFAADYDTISLIGTLGDWTQDYVMTETSDNVYTLTMNLEAGNYEFKFRANKAWEVNWGGTFMASGQEFGLNANGANICIAVEETCDVIFKLDLTNADAPKCTVTIGGQIDEPVVIPNIKVHISVPEGWGDVYAYVWNPEQLGSWSGTKVENGVIDVPAQFAGMVINNGSGRQTSDITDIDLTKEEVWIVVNEYNGYTLYYTEPDLSGDPEPVGEITVHISAPEDWAEVYAFVWNPDQLGPWPGTKVEDGVVVVPALFDGMVISNGNGTQTWDIKDIDLTKEEVWITIGAVQEDGMCSYALSYTGFADLPQTGDTITVVAVAMALSAVCGLCLLTKKDF